MDADFPFKKFSYSSMTPSVITSETESVMIDETVQTPTLEELIELCGEDFRLQTFFSKNEVEWQADNSGNFYIRPDIIAETGATPLEATAKLWLALNKK